MSHALAVSRPLPAASPPQQKFQLQHSQRAEAFATQIGHLPKAQRRAALIIAADLATHIFPLPGGGGLIERCAGYWLPMGTLSRGVSQLTFPLIYTTAGAVRRACREAEAEGLPTRHLQPGQRRGRFWHIPESGIQLVRETLELLKEDGLEPERTTAHYQLAPPILLPLHTYQKKLWVQCPEHDDAEPSALLNTSGCIYCFGCGKLTALGVVVSGEMVEYRRILSRDAAPVAALSPASPAQKKVGNTVESVAVLHDTANQPPSTDRGFFCDLSLSATNGPYSIDAVLKAGAPSTHESAPRNRDRLRLVGVRVQTSERMIEVPPMPLGFVLGRRFGARPMYGHKKGKYGMQRAYSSCMDLLDVLRASQKRIPGAARKAKGWERELGQEAHAEVRLSEAGKNKADPKHFLPDLYVSLDYQEWETCSSFSVECREEGKEAWVLQPQNFQARAGKWVGVDIDGVQVMPGKDGLKRAGEKIQAMLEAHPAFSGRCGVVQTSSYGVQVVAELTRTRWDLRGFYADPNVRKMLGNLDAMCLGAFEQEGMVGGHADPTVHAPGRMMRRPGPRVDKRGASCISRLVYATA